MILEARFRGRLSWPLRCALLLTTLAVLPVCIQGVRGAPLSQSQPAVRRLEAQAEILPRTGQGLGSVAATAKKALLAGVVVEDQGQPIASAKV